MQQSIITPRLLIIDEISYLPFTAHKSEVLFDVIAKRYVIGAIVWNSNLLFGQWGQMFVNVTALTFAILDRVLHHSHVLQIKEDSYRIKAKKQAGLMENTQK